MTRPGADESISPVIWMVAIANGVIVLLMSFLLYPDRHWPHVLMSAMLSAMIAMLVCVLFVFESPFAGMTALSSAPFRHSLEVYDSVDRTP